MIRPPTRHVAAPIPRLRCWVGSVVAGPVALRRLAELARRRRRHRPGRPDPGLDQARLVRPLARIAAQLAARDRRRSGPPALASAPASGACPTRRRSRMNTPNRRPPRRPAPRDRGPAGPAAHDCLPALLPRPRGREVAEVLGCSAGTVKSNLSDARRALARRLETRTCASMTPTPISTPNCAQTAPSGASRSTGCVPTPRPVTARRAALTPAAAWPPLPGGLAAAVSGAGQLRRSVADAAITTAAEPRRPGPASALVRPDQPEVPTSAQCSDPTARPVGLSGFLVGPGRDGNAHDRRCRPGRNYGPTDVRAVAPLPRAIGTTRYCSAAAFPARHPPPGDDAGSPTGRQVQRRRGDRPEVAVSASRCRTPRRGPDGLVAHAVARGGRGVLVTVARHRSPRDRPSPAQVEDEIAGTRLARLMRCMCPPCRWLSRCGAATRRRPADRRTSCSRSSRTRCAAMRRPRRTARRRTSSRCARPVAGRVGVDRIEEPRRRSRSAMRKPGRWRPPSRSWKRCPPEMWRGRSKRGLGRSAATRRTHSSVDGQADPHAVRTVVAVVGVTGTHTLPSRYWKACDAAVIGRARRLRGGSGERAEDDGA